MSYPAGLPKRLRKHWNRPWTRAAQLSPWFRRWLKRHGYLTPHFRTADAHSPDGTKIPKHLATAARNHAFRLERLRHAQGDRPIKVRTWYRSPSYNRARGGARRSKHMAAIATDHPAEWVEDRGGQAKVRSVAARLGFKGIGVYPSGDMHLDSRHGPLTVWSSWRR